MTEQCFAWVAKWTQGSVREVRSPNYLPAMAFGGGQAMGEMADAMFGDGP